MPGAPHDPSAPADADADADGQILLVDPRWQPASPGAEPGPGDVVGLWSVGADGDVGRFRANLDHRPVDASSPTDAVDAVLHLLADGRVPEELLGLVLRDCQVDVAMNGDRRPLVTPSSDGVLCVLVATAEPHRARVLAPAWERVGVEDLAAMLAEGVDVLLNPGGALSARMAGDLVRDAALMGDDEAAVALLSLDDPPGDEDAPHPPGNG